MDLIHDNEVDALTLDELARLTHDEIERRLMPLDAALTPFDALTLDEASVRAVRNGQFLPGRPDLTTSLVRAYDERGHFVALLEWSGMQALKPKKVFDATT